MNRKIILVLTIILILIIGIFLYFKFTGNNNVPSEGTGGGLKNLLPFGTDNSSKNTPNTGNTPLIIGTSNTSTEDGDGLSNIIQRLRHYTIVPTSGHIVLEKEKDVIKDRIKVKEKGYYIRYMDRATGHIFESKSDNPEIQKVSNTTIPKVYETIFTPSGNSLITRFLDADENIISYYITLKDKITPVSTTPKTSTSTQTVNAKTIEEKSVLKDIVGTYLTPNIKEVALSPSGTKILESLYGGDGGILSILDSNKKSRTVLSHPLREWLLAMPSEAKAVITTKPSGLSLGFSYLLDTNTGSLSKIVGGIKGLTVLPNKNLVTFLIGNTSNSLELSLYSKDEIKGISLKTLPEKCVWSNKMTDVVFCAVPENIPFGTYPDIWYKGKVLFNDTLWSINTKTGETKLISNLPKESGQQIDAINLQISSDDNYLTFINKVDLTLWGIDLTLKK